MQKKLKKTFRCRKIVQANNEKALAKGMTAFLERCSSVLGVQDEVFKLTAALKDSRNINMVLEDLTFLMNQVAPKGCIFGSMGASSYGFVSSDNLKAIAGEMIYRQHDGGRLHERQAK